MFTFWRTCGEVTGTHWIGACHSTPIPNSKLQL